MRSLLVLTLSVLVGVVTGTGLSMLVPQSEPSTEQLAAEIHDLEAELGELQRQPAALPTYYHWERFKRYLDTYGRLKVDRFHTDQLGRPDFGGDPWGGVISGPALDLLLAARVVQGTIPVYFDRIAIDKNTARMTFYALGAKEN